jgi:hypothetical protein
LRTSAPKVKPVATAPSQRTKTATVRFAGHNRVPMPGSIITRDYKGQSLQVRVLPKGFEFEGEVYKSLSAVAKSITGSHCNGYLFFRLRDGGAK